MDHVELENCSPYDVATLVPFTTAKSASKVGDGTVIIQSHEYAPFKELDLPEHLMSIHIPFGSWHKGALCEISRALH